MKVIYESEPKFPATDQHPDAVRYKVGDRWVDSTSGKPTQVEVDEALNPVDPLATLKGKLADGTITHVELVALLKAERGL